jgi:hypothetical protein
MPDVERAAAVRGKRIQMTWTAGPTRGSTHEHVFHQDGTVEWYDADPRKAPSDRQKDGSARERPQYAAFRVADDIYLVSYLASSGFALTVALHFGEQKIVGFATSSKDWFPIQGTFQVVN